MNAPISETKKITLARLACLCFDEGCPIHPIRNGSPKWCRSVTDRDGSSLCVSFGNVGGSSWWCRFATVCQFAMDLQNIFGGVMVCGESVGGSSRSGRIVTTLHNRDGWCRFVTVCQFARVLENIQSGVMVCVENVGGSSRLGRIATTRHNRHGWWHFVTVCQFAIDLENIYGGVMERGENLGGWWRFVTVCQFARDNIQGCDLN